MKDVEDKKYRSFPDFPEENPGFPDFPEETIKQKLIDPKGLLSFSTLSE